MKTYTVIYIPARGGSKGIPRKNLADLGGHPLVAHTIQTALESRLAERVIVSTEDEEIAAVAREYGAEVPFLRPQELAQDNSTLDDVIDHAQDWLLHHEGRQADVYALLLPTSPFRPKGLIDKLLSKVVHGPYFGAITVLPHPRPKGPLLSGPPGQETLVRIPALGGPFFKPVLLAGVYTAKTKDPQATFKGMPGPPDYIEIIRNPVYGLDIDSPQDLALAREIIRQGKFNPPLA